MSAPTIGHVDNSILINAPIDLVWEATNDVERWPELFTEYASAEILERTGDTVRFRLAMHPDENGKVWSWVSERTLDRAARRVVARRVEPGPFEFMNIEWTYEAEGDGTRMRWIQDFRMRPDAPIDTAAMTDRINANTAIQMDVIRQKVERLASEPAQAIRTVSIDDVPANRRRGGDIRTILSPATVGATSGFMGTLRLAPAEVVTEHWHPYSEEFLFCVEGEITLRLNGCDRTLRANEGVLIPVGVRHRLMNDGAAPAFLVFQLGPLAPTPQLGHVDTEPLPPGQGAGE
jgi:quercetin dioxygenase-like cupin family protein/ribosome-associated toxin RatA of RatAB toxin-antitoxin module